MTGINYPAGDFGGWHLDPAGQISLVRENLALAIALYRSAEVGLINVSFIAHFDAYETRKPLSVTATAPLQARDTRELIRCANNQIRAAFAFSARQTNRALSAAFGNSPPVEPPSDIRSARCIFHLLDRTFDANPLTPAWVCPPERRGSLAVETVGFRLETDGLHGREVQWSDFGGLPKYLDLLAYCMEAVRGMEAAPDAVPPNDDVENPDTSDPDDPFAEILPAPSQPTASSKSGPASSHQYPSKGQPKVLAPAILVEPVGPLSREAASVSLNSAEADMESVSDFLRERCAVGDGELILAATLFDAYLEWSAARGDEPVGQRRFGMHLTAAGLERRRRGRGKHWWMGVGLRKTAVAQA